MDALAVSSEILQLVTFKLVGEEYAIDILKVQEINRMVDITSVPNTQSYVEGVINLRGKVIPVINLRKKFGLDAKSADSQSRIMVVDVGTTVGLIVDSVSEVLRLNSDTVEPPPPMTGGAGSEFIKGVGKLKDRLLILLDIDKLLGHEEIGTVTTFTTNN
ncbi:MAG TPA: chemotaxis protein CheW [Thermodesulfovibrionales bacterium]|jgi:purine-binding chemotaxis protein CheW|nr:chemotaxis protein CheW [Thermodesulfovibrionales bacterium]